MSRLQITLVMFSAFAVAPIRADTIFFVDEVGNGLVQRVINGQVVDSARLTMLGNTLDPLDPNGPRPLAYDLVGNRLIGQIPQIGDVVLNEPGGSATDLLRFNAAGQLLFYSDNVEGVDARADVGLTATRQGSGLLGNLFTSDEAGLEGAFINGLRYVPQTHTITSNDPGFLPAAGFGTVTYNFFSDGTIPEPGSFVLLAIGLAGLVGWSQKRKKTIS
jgi:hypothetical protein